MSAELYFLQDSRGTVGNSLMWWAGDGNGYSSDLSKADLYTRDEAIAKHRSRPSDVPWPQHYVTARQRIVVDMQYLDRAEAVCMPDSLYYLQHGNNYDGNDLLWRTCDGAIDADLSLAKLYTYDEAIAYLAAHRCDTAWPMRYIDTKVRPALSRQHADILVALAGAGIELVKPRREQPQRYRCRCHGCGCFLSASQYYAEPCPKCRTENRP